MAEWPNGRVVRRPGDRVVKWPGDPKAKWPAALMASKRTQLPGALAVVTGAGSGIGRATARALAREGAFVVAVDIDLDAASETATACSGAAYRADVADRRSMELMASAVTTEHGIPDVLVNNAGVGMTGRFLDTTPEDWDWILGINLRGVIHGCQLFGPAMVARGAGHVVNISSGLAYTPRATEPAYVTSKAAVLALTQCLRADWGPAGVGVTAVCPGVVNTSIVAGTRYRGDRGDQSERIARLFRRGHPPDLVARAVIRAIERNLPLVPVGVEAYAGWVFHRLLPSRLLDRAARTSLGGI